jgi:DNA-binding beta-propeller fold protein YncE
MMRHPMRGFRWLVLCFALLSVLTGCGEAAKEAVGSHNHVARTNGGAVVLSYDERIAVVTNRNEGFVTVFSLKPERGANGLVVNTTVLDVGADSEPWSAVIGADDDTAFVILRKTQKLIRVDHLRSGPTVYSQSIDVGSEPMGIAISPTGKLVFVANWGEGTISTVFTSSFQPGASLELNDSLRATGSVGEISSRPALAHPRALAITDDGDQDDDDETLYATEFFSQSTPSAKNDSASVDNNRQGYVYPVSVGLGQLGRAIPLSPVSATGFADSDGNMTSCFPNQLFAAAAEGDRLYVTSLCTSPRGPLDKQGDSNANFKTLLHPAVFAIDTSFDSVSETRANLELPEEGRLLTQVLQGLYDADAAAGAATTHPRMPLIPNDIAFGKPSKAGVSAYVLAQGADALFRLSYGPDRQLIDIGVPERRYVGLPLMGNAVGVAVSRRSQRPFALVLSDVAQKLSIVDLTSEKTADDKSDTMPDTPRATAALDSPANRGRALFTTGLGVWSFQGAAWSSCESCHPGGGSDGITWYFSRGPRRTPSAANTYEKGRDQPGRRMMLWGANVDEIHDVEVIVRTVSGGAGAMLWNYPPDDRPSNDCRLIYDGKAPPAPKAGTSICSNGAKRTSRLLNGLNGSLATLAGDGAGCGPDVNSCDNTAREEWNDIDAFIRSLRLPRPPTNLEREPGRVKAGRALFDKAGCGNCHGGSQWTVSRLFYGPSFGTNGDAPSIRPQTPPSLGKLRDGKYNVPAELAKLNPPANNSLDVCEGAKCATFRMSAQSGSDADKLNLLYGDPALYPNAADAAALAVADAAKAAANDQIRCALRDVGTFPAFGSAGVASSTGTAPLEVRSDMTTAAQGKDGFNVPSLFGLFVGAPYLHAGNARSLEELFDDNFRTHHQSVDSTFLSVTQAADREDQIRNLIWFLLSIDEQTPPVEMVPAYDFCAWQP